MFQLQYDNSEFNKSVQDGSAAGQLVLHIHVNILPINDGGLDRNSEIYSILEEWAPIADNNQPLQKLDVPKDDASRYRMVEETKEEYNL